jgi:nicotinate phosphoribosyltransferase
VAGGLEQVLEYLERLHFSAESLAYLESLEQFSAPFLQHLSRMRFTGEVRAVAEGTVVFAHEPILEVSAPMPQAQLIETYLLNQITFQTLIASKAARAVLAAGGRTLVDFGSRRAHGTDAALKAARALYLAGYDSTSNVLAGQHFGIPVAGTMAHSYIQAHESEAEAFAAFVRSYPSTTLLVDTYDTEGGVRLAAEVARQAKEAGGEHIRAIRLDSGDLAALAKKARSILDEAGLEDVDIFASGGLDEHEIASLVAAGAPIDGFGVGTAAVVAKDAPTLDSAYKLVSYADKPRLKLSPEKETLPDRKQVYRVWREGVMAEDVIALASEHLPGEPLLDVVMREGRRTDAGIRGLQEARERAKQQLGGLPAELRALSPAPKAYPTRLSDGMRLELEKVRARLKTR